MYTTELPIYITLIVHRSTYQAFAGGNWRFIIPLILSISSALWCVHFHKKNIIINRDSPLWTQNTNAPISKNFQHHSSVVPLHLKGQHGWRSECVLAYNQHSWQGCPSSAWYQRVLTSRHGGAGGQLGSAYTCCCTLKGKPHIVLHSGT